MTMAGPKKMGLELRVQLSSSHADGVISIYDGTRAGILPVPPVRSTNYLAV